MNKTLFLKSFFTQDRLYYCMISNICLFFQILSTSHKSELKDLQSIIDLVLFAIIFLMQVLYIVKPGISILQKERNFFFFIIPSLSFHFYLTFFTNFNPGFFFEILILLNQVEKTLKEYKNRLSFHTCVFAFLCFRFRFFVEEIIISVLYIVLFVFSTMRNITKRKGKTKKPIEKTTDIELKSRRSTKEFNKFQILNSFKEGIVLFDSNLKIKWYNDYLLNMMEIPTDTPLPLIEKSILNIRQEQNSLLVNDLNKKMKFLVGAFQTKINIISDEFYKENYKKGNKYHTIKTNDKSFTIKTLKLHNISIASKNHEDEGYYLNQNGNFEVSMSSLKTRRKFLKEILKSFFIKLDGRTIDSSLKLDKFNIYGTIKTFNKSIKRTFFISFYHFNDNIFVILRKLDQNDLILSLYNNHLWQSKQLASMCHELRTPLNSITNILEILKEQNKDNQEDQNEYLYNALSSSKLLLASINDFLDYFSIISKIFDLEIMDTNLNKIINEVSDLFKWTAERKALAFEIHLDENLPKKILTDPNRLKQIIINLLSNALRFTSQGSVVMKLTSKGTEYVKISIKDTGTGIEHDVLTNLSKFNSNEEDITHTTGGFGLCIANHLVNYIGPQMDLKKTKIFKGLKVKTEVGVGSTFSFLVRDCVEANSGSEEAGKKNMDSENEDNNDSVISAAEDSLEESDQHIINEHFRRNETDTSYKFFKSMQLKEMALKDVKIVRGEQKENKQDCLCSKVLAIDDNPFNLFVLTETFKSLKININVANQGVDAIQMVSDFLSGKKSKFAFCQKCKFFKLILMDIDMPIKNGFECTVELKKIFNDYNINVPIVALSAFSQSDYKKKAKEVGMDSFIEKPFNREKLENVILNFLN